MGAKNDDFDNYSGDGGATRKEVKSRCLTEEVVPGRFIRKCEKTEEILKECVGRPTETVEYIRVYTEEDVTGQMVKDPFPLEPAKAPESSYFPGLHSDMEAIERSFNAEMKRLLEAAEKMKEYINSESPLHGIPNETPKKDAPKSDDLDDYLAEVAVEF